MSARCDGSNRCKASPHIHGCWADLGDCDTPSGHKPIFSPPPTRSGPRSSVLAAAKACYALGDHLNTWDDASADLQIAYIAAAGLAV